MILELDVYGVRASLAGDAEAVRLLARHLPTFGSVSQGEAALRVELRREPATLDVGERARVDHVFERGLVYNRGSRCWIDHHGVAVSRYDFEHESGSVSALETADLVELGYLMLSSRLGLMLERRGLVRVHALGVSVRGRAALVLAPSGGGKSRMALAILQQTDAELLGDDIVLVDRSGYAHPFPHPIGIAAPDVALGLGPTRAFVRRAHPSKWLLDLDDLGQRLARSPTQVALVAMMFRVSGPPGRMLAAPRTAVASALWRDMVVGLGLPQVIELVARRGAHDLLGLAPDVVRRVLVAQSLTRRARGAYLEVADAASAARQLVAELSAMG